MSDRDLILTLGKVIIAAAWVDGEITNEEINSLKDLLFRLPRSAYKQGPQIAGREWAELEMYIDSPVDEAERARLMEELKTALRTSQDRALALSALEELIQADGVVTDEERAVVKEIKTALQAVDLGIFAQMGRLISGPIRRRSAAVVNVHNRERQLVDFVRNKVFYAVRRRLNLDAGPSNISEKDWRKLSLAGGLMAHVAHADREVTDDEFDVMVDALQASWDITREAAAIVAEVALSEVAADLDYFRLTRQFATHTSENERVRFLDVLLAVAGVDGSISHDENEEIRRIALSLKLTQQQYAGAKLKVIQER